MKPPNQKTAVLGWGSLISNPQGDASIGQQPLRIVEVFHPGGPILPVEFSRISKDGRLTLVIDSKHGTPCATFYATSAMPDFGLARQNLADREGTALQHVHSATGGQDYDEPIKRGISAWCVKNQWHSAIWTGLPPKFSFYGFTEFSTEAAIAYLKSLSGAVRRKALDYIAAAPTTIQTPVRTMASKLFVL